jgi:hypothetical protein
MAERYPVLVNASPALTFPKQNFHDFKGQLEFAGRLIISLLEYKKTIDENRFEQQFAGLAPLDMTQV